MDKMGRAVDDHFQTNVPGIYAIGDLIPGPMLAHRRKKKVLLPLRCWPVVLDYVNHGTVPWILYISSEVVVRDLQKNKPKSRIYGCWKFSFAANDEPLKPGDRQKVREKFWADNRSDKIIGGHIAGPSRL